MEDLTRCRNVQVTLQILRGLIDKSPRDLSLYAPYVLRVLLAVLDAHNLTTVEDSVPTFQAFCEHQDTATLAADQELIRQFEKVVKSYAQFASDEPIAAKTPLSAPLKIRWRTAGLQALKSITSSEAVAVDGGKQIPLVVTTILDNLYRHGGEQLLGLGQRAGADKDTAIRRRMSIATVRTSESVPASGAPAPATAADADRLAEEEAGLLALQSMRQLFTGTNRGQVRLATTSLLQFLMAKPLEARPETAKSSTRSGRTTHWATTVIEMVAQVTPVQDRFIIVVTAVETLIRCQTAEENLDRQLVLATLIEYLLGSSINMVGLSIMDVLLGLVQHILLLLQLGGKGAQILPHHQQSEETDLFKTDDKGSVVLVSGDQKLAEVPRTSTASAKRQELLLLLRRCIANLAAHVYYSDQITDIVSAILARLKPPTASAVGSTAAAIERPGAAIQALSDSIKMKEDQSTDEFFSFATARVTALDSVKDVLLVANKRGAFVGAGAIGRNKVPIGTWEGTQWLLRDEDRRVRYAYVEALLTWLRWETTRADLRVIDARGGPKKPRTNGSVEKPAHIAARSSPGASQATGWSKQSKSSFLQLLHLAVYDNALDAPEAQTDTVLSHTLLVALVDRLGVNAIQYGLPMVFRLQDDAASDAIPTARGKISACSLVHGYLFYLSQRFEFDTTMIGHELETEISRRRKARTWLGAIRVPAMPVEQIAALPDHADLGETRDALLNPFASTASLVDQIAFSYSSAMQSPPASPMASPAKSTALPLTTVSNDRSVAELPNAVRERMSAKWTKELCIAAVEKESSRTDSPRGSRTGTSNSGPNGLLAPNGTTPRELSPGMEALPLTKREGGGPPLSNLQTAQPRTSNPQMSGPPTPISSSEQAYTLRVDDMKRVLAGGSLVEAFSLRQRQPSLRSGSPLRNSNTAQHDFAAKTGSGRGLRGPSLLSVGSDSIVDAEGFESASEGDLERPLPSPQAAPSTAEVAQHLQQQRGRSLELDPGLGPTDALDREDSRPSTGRSRPRSASQTSAEDPRANAKALKGEADSTVVRGSIVAHEGVPPVPPLPEGLAASGPASHAPGTSAIRDTPPSQNVRDRSRGRTSDGRGARPRAAGERRVMVQALLGSIEVSNDTSKGIGLPPY